MKKLFFVLIICSLFIVSGISQYCNPSLPGGCGADTSTASITNLITDRCTLSAGTCTITNSRIKNATNVICMTQFPAGSLGALYISGRNIGVNYTVASLNVLETSTVGCILLEP